MEPRFTRVVRKRYPESDLQELLAAAEAVQSLLTTPGWRVLTGLLDAESEAEMRTLDGLRALDGYGVPRLAEMDSEQQARYVRCHAYRTGLSGANDAAHALVEMAADAVARAEASNRAAAVAAGG